jgi:hypothetical protein
LNLDEFDELAGYTLRPLVDAPPKLLLAFAAGLGMAGQPVAEFASPIANLAVDLELSRPMHSEARLAIGRPRVSSSDTSRTSASWRKCPPDVDRLKRARVGE